MTSFAPAWIRLLVPALVRALMLPGTANTSRPCSAAESAVSSAPLLAGASTTTTPSDSPLTIRLRSGKLCASGRAPGAKVLTSAPERVISAASLA